jgi:type IV pilus assembly protein PilW
MNKKILFPARYKGLTLIEIMVALVIGSFLMLGAMGLFMSNKRIYTEQDTMGRLQENGRFAINLLMNDLRMTGYIGCSDDSSLLTNALPGSATATSLSNMTNHIEGSENAGGWLPSGLATPVGTSDGITLRYIKVIDPANASLSADMANATANVPLTCAGADCGNFFSVGEAVAISDCGGTDLFSITTVNTNSLAHTGLSRAYPSSATLMSRYVANRYYIANNASGNPSLFRLTFAQDKDDIDSDSNTTEFLVQNQEMIEGVENMQILYGVDNNADLIANSYVDATGVAGAGGWDNVVSVRVAILVRTIDSDPNNELDTSTYDLLGTVIDPVDDNRRRRVYSTTVQIRNRT